MTLLNPKKFVSFVSDPRSREIMEKTIAFFETKGLAKIKDDDHNRVWYADFLEFQQREQIFYKLFTPVSYGNGTTRWDTYCNAAYAEILGFYGLPYWYTWQVTALGLGPVWMSKNEKVKQQVAQALAQGGVFGFGLSEKEHGADIYSIETTLYPQANGTFLAKGSKYYIGNANEATLVSVFGKIADTKEYVFFVVNPKHPCFNLVQNVVNAQNYVAEFKLEDYPITQDDILLRGSEAWDASLNTVNICKYNLGWGSIGMCTHAFYEALNHASTRRLFNSYVTDFSHIKQFLVDAYARLVAMKLFAERASDYMRQANSNDRRYLLFNPMVKMKVTSQGEEVINLLWDVIAAKGFEKDMFFEMATRDIRALPKLEGTVHVNMALVVKFMKNYFFHHKNYAPLKRRDDIANDDFLFNQGPAKGLRNIQFHDYNIAYNSVHTPNVKVFRKQISLFKMLLMFSPPTKKQSEDFDFLLIVGEMFALVVYGQLIIENAKLSKTNNDVLDQIFDFMVRDFAKFALQLFSKPATGFMQGWLCKRMLKKAVANNERFERVWNSQVYAKCKMYK